MLCKACHKREIETSRSSCKCSICLDKCLASQKIHYQKHREKVLNYVKNYYQEHKQENLDYHRKYYQDNKERITEYMKDRYINPEKHAKVLKSAKEYMNRDHIIPLSVGGTNYIDNIQPLCRSCNSAKHTKIIDYRWDVT